MNLIKWIKDLKSFQKIIMLLCITVLIATFNYYYYNFPIFKLPKNKIKYNVDLKNIAYENLILENNILVTDDEDKSSKIVFNIDNHYIRYIVIDLESQKNQFFVSLDAKLLNSFDKELEYSNKQKCYGNMKKCGFNINKKAQQIEMKFNESVKINSITIENSFFFNWITFIFWSVLINLLVILVMFSDFLSKKIHILTFILSLGIGIIFLFASHNMTSTTYDGQTHFKYYNSLKNEKTEADLQYERDNHQVTGIIDFESMDTNVEKDSYNRLINELSKNKVNNATKTGSLLQAQRLIYFPIALILKIASILNINYTTGIFLARFFQLIMYSFVIMFAVKKMPNYKLFTMFICLCPQILFFATNFNYDPAIIATLILGYSIFVSEYFNKDKKINKKNVMIAIFAIMLASFSKFVYIPLLLLFLLLPGKKFTSKKQKDLFCIILLGIVLSLVIAKCFIMLTAKAGTSTILALGEISPPQQIQSILNHPFSFINLFYHEVILKGLILMIAPEAFGRFSYYGTMGMEFSYFLLIFIFVFSYTSEKKKVYIPKKHRIIMLGIYFAIIAFIWVGMYLCWTPVGSNTIEGVQPRYFIPLLLPIFYCFSNNKFVNKTDEKKTIILCTFLYIISTSLLIFNFIISKYCL